GVEEEGVGLLKEEFVFLVGLVEGGGGGGGDVGLDVEVGDIVLLEHGDGGLLGGNVKKEGLGGRDRVVGDRNW
uniref:hypothetical protein n=1 Tax=Neisseria sicca TaxID=490 RepID=UPI001C99B3B9